MEKKQLDSIIDWCRQKLAQEKANPFGLSGKRLEGYETAMLAVMSYLHNEKKKLNKEDNKMKNYADIYATLVNEAEARTKKDEQKPTRFEMLFVLEDLDVTLTEAIDLVEKLHADGFVSE